MTRARSASGGSRRCVQPRYWKPSSRDGTTTRAVGEESRWFRRVRFSRWRRSEKDLVVEGGEERKRLADEDASAGNRKVCRREGAVMPSARRDWTRAGRIPRV